LSTYRLHPKVVALAGLLGLRLGSIGPDHHGESSSAIRRSLTTTAAIIASIAVFYALPTYLELSAASHVGLILAVFLIGNVLGCLAIALVDWRIAASVYSSLSLFEFGLMRFAHVRPEELVWLADLVPTVIIVGHILLARSEEPSENEKSTIESGELTSWKAIADYLEINVRTAQRWEQERGLPVRRFSGEKGRVLSAIADLERWRRVNLIKPNWWSDLRLLRCSLLAASALLLASVGWSVSNYLSGHRLGPPSRLVLDGDQIIVRDSNGRQLWTHQFPEPPIPSDAKHAFWFGHLATKTNTDTLYVYRPEQTTNSELYCFSEKGHERWKFTPGRRVSDAKLDYPSVYFINGLKVLPGSPLERSRIVVSSNHGWSHPDQVAVLGPDGKLQGEYWHSGHLTSMLVDSSIAPNCQRVILGGVDNGRQLASLVVLDAGNVRGALREEDNSPFQLKGFEPGSEEALVWFNRSCLNEGSEPFNYVETIAFVPGGIEVVVRESGPAGAYIVYVLDKNYNVTYLEPSSGFRARHSELEREGKLGHQLDKELQKLREIRLIRRSTASL
jgi:hypothetical protein